VRPALLDDEDVLQLRRGQNPVVVPPLLDAEPVAQRPGLGQHAHEFSLAAEAERLLLQPDGCDLRVRRCGAADHGMDRTGALEDDAGEMGEQCQPSVLVRLGSDSLPRLALQDTHRRARHRSDHRGGDEFVEDLPHRLRAPPVRTTA